VGRDLKGTAGLSGAVRSAAALAEHTNHLLPTTAPLRPLFPDGGLRRGSTVTVEGLGATSLAFALLAAPNAAGSWCAAVGLGSLGLLAAAEAGISLPRMALVPEPGRNWPVIVAALLDAFQIVLLRPPSSTSVQLQRRLLARLREHDSVLVSVGAGALAHLSPDVRLIGTASVWEGLGWGSGHLRSRHLHVRAEGRRLAGQARHCILWLPDHRGQVAADRPWEVPAADDVVASAASLEAVASA
jgi:hypothetical protein